MADTKISALAAVTDVLATDEFVLARSGATKKIAASTLVGGAWSDYTPALTAVTTNPTLGTGGTIAGIFTQIGKLVHVRVSIIFGSSGAAAGSGQYRISLPAVTPASSQLTWGGSGFTFDGTNGRVLVTELDIANARIHMWTDAATARVAHNVPHAWNNNHQLHADFIYEAA